MPCRCRQFVVTGFFSASVCSQRLHHFVANFILLALQKRRFFFQEFFTVPINGKFSKSFELNNNAKVYVELFFFDTNC